MLIKNHLIIYLFFIGLFASLAIGCKKNDNEIRIKTLEVTDISPISAICGGNITDDGGFPISSRGMCWNTNPNPTIWNNIGLTSDGAGLGSFTSRLIDLTKGTKYYVRAYATSKVDTSYGNEVTFTTLSPTYGNGVTDVDGNTYETVIIGTQEWMAENLKTTKFNDGTEITPFDGISGSWIVLPIRSSTLYYWNNNDISNKHTYGALYNYNTVATNKLCPLGWHVPSNQEWRTLWEFAGGRYESISGGGTAELGEIPFKKLRSIRTEPDEHPRWNAPNTGATDDFGFAALPGGRLYYFVRPSDDYAEAILYPTGGEGHWWAKNSKWVINQYIIYEDSPVHEFLSVRCVKDN